MKLIKCLLIVFVSIISVTVSAQRVALISDGRQPVLVANELVVLNEWNAILNKEGINANLKYLSIIQIDKVYYLRATGADGYVSTIILQGSGSETYLEAIGISCTSKACGTNTGCVPNIDLTGCTPGCESNDCRKTVTNLRKGINGDRDRCTYYFSCDPNHFL